MGYFCVSSLAQGLPAGFHCKSQEVLVSVFAYDRSETGSELCWALYTAPLEKIVSSLSFSYDTPDGVALKRPIISFDS
jgi:hypothetical protein